GAAAGGAATLRSALRTVAGDRACLVVPAHTANNSTTSPSFRAATAGLDRAGVDRYLRSMEGFDPATTPSFRMGAFAEHIRRHPESVRSTHPQTSFAALGPAARELMAGHRPDCHLGPDSPLGALYDADAAILLLGVGYRVCTAFHLAEYRRPDPPTRRYHCFVGTGPARRRYEYTDVDLDDGDFDRLGKHLEASDETVARGRVGGAQARLVAVRSAVDFAVRWMATYR
ncbi:MAG TPA: AAC(3) family N-acetyltransferase, partial [Rugosimonospora sp.]|nr:AAC(3) family N-acetyltransferase [Rugosimonospora sp.]